MHRMHEASEQATWSWLCEEDSPCTVAAYITQCVHLTNASTRLELTSPPGSQCGVPASHLRCRGLVHKSLYIPTAHPESARSIQSMYWPINAANILSPPYPLAGETITAMRPNRRGNMFVTLTKNGLGVWDVRVSHISREPCIALSAAQRLASRCGTDERTLGQVGRTHRRLLVIR